MRGKTVKKINRFVTKLIEQTPEDQRTKSRQQMINDVKRFWKQSIKAKKFINHVIMDKDISYVMAEA